MIKAYYLACKESFCIIILITEIESKRAILMSNKDQLRQSIWEELRRVSANSSLYNQATADKTGLYTTDIECMDYLVQNGPLTAGALAKHMGLATGTVTALIDRLEKA